MGSFNKYVGGSPTNMACGTARLGLRSALITRVGDEHMGRFLREELAREGVDTRGVVTDPERLTALVLLGIRDEAQFPLIFYRENCADMALCEDDIDPAFIAEARAVVATGTHLSHPRTEAAVLKALRLAREGGARTALDIDYRPNLWGLAGHGAGEARFIESAAVTARLQATLHLFDLIVGTEEEFHIAGGTTDTLAALRAVRAVSGAVLVCKRGPMGAVAFTGAIPDSLDAGESGPGFPIEVFNVLGAGDGFMSGLLKGWLDGVDWPTALTWANACGALAVSRHGCTPAYPSWEELQFFLARGVVTPACARMPHSNRCIGPPTGMRTGPRCASSPSTTVPRWKRWRGPRRNGSVTSSFCACRRPRRWPRGSRAMASSATGGSDRARCIARRGRGSGSGGRWNCPARARCGWNPSLAPIWAD
jgi:5-dehydro-2-deoxygluconokinase